LNRFDEYDKRNRITDSGLEANFNYRFTSSLQLDFGYQLMGNDLSHRLPHAIKDLRSTSTTNAFSMLPKWVIYRPVTIGISGISGWCALQLLSRVAGQ
jgi:hypothetical protein